MSGLIRVNPATDAILHVDVRQSAFMGDHYWNGRLIKGGGLPVPDGEGVISAVLHDTSFFLDNRRYFSIDEHPLGHISLASSYRDYPVYTELTLDEVMRWKAQRITSSLFDYGDLCSYLDQCPGKKQTLWPDHGISGTHEVEFHPAFAHLGSRRILYKGLDPKCDSYSAESDNMGRSTGLAERQWDHGVRRIFLDGIAFTHCVGWSALGYARRGFDVFVIKNATRSVPIPGAEEAMDEALAHAGVHVINSAQLSR